MAWSMGTGNEQEPEELHQLQGLPRGRVHICVCVAVNCTNSHGRDDRQASQHSVTHLVSQTRKATMTPTLAMAVGVGGGGGV